MRRRLLAATAAILVLSVAAGGCGGSVPKLVDVAPNGSFQLAVTGQTSYYTMQVRGATEDVHVKSMHLVPIRTSPNVQVVGYYVQENGGIAPFGTPWKHDQVLGFGAGYNKALGVVAPDVAVIKAKRLTPIGMVVHFAGEGTSIWKGMEVTYSAGGHTTSELIPERITLCVDPHETTLACSDAT